MPKTFIKYFFVWSLSVLILAGGLVLIQKSGLFPQLFPKTAKANPDCNVTDNLSVTGEIHATGSIVGLSFGTSGIGAVRASYFILDALDCSSGPLCNTNGRIINCINGSVCDGDNGIQICDTVLGGWRCLENMDG